MKISIAQTAIGRVNRGVIIREIQKRPLSTRLALASLLQCCAPVFGFLAIVALWPAAGRELFKLSAAMAIVASLCAGVFLRRAATALGLRRSPVVAKSWREGNIAFCCMVVIVATYDTSERMGLIWSSGVALNVIYCVAKCRCAAIGCCRWCNYRSVTYRYLGMVGELNEIEIIATLAIATVGVLLGPGATAVAVLFGGHSCVRCVDYLGRFRRARLRNCVNGEQAAMFGVLILGGL